MEPFGGWLQFGRGQLKSSQKRAYFRVSGNLVSAHAGKNFPAENVFSLNGAKVAYKKSRQIVLVLRDGSKLRFGADSEREGLAWRRKFAVASSKTFDESYVIDGELQRDGTFPGTSKDAGVAVVVRILRQQQERPKACAQIENELKTRMSIFHRNVQRTHEIFDDGVNYYIVMEELSGSSLVDFIHERGKLNEILSARIAWDLLSAIEHVHDLRIIHRDVRAENVIMVHSFPETVPLGDPVVKLCSVNRSSIHRPLRASDRQRDNFLGSTFIGSNHYISPEQARREIYGPSVDIWACGIIIYFMLMGNYPFPTSDDAFLVDIMRILKEAKISYGYEWDTVSYNCRQLVEKMLSPNSVCRPTPGACRRSPWFYSEFRKIAEDPTRYMQFEKPTSVNPPTLSGLIVDPRSREPLRLGTFLAPAMRTLSFSKNKFPQEEAEAAGRPDFEWSSGRWSSRPTSGSKGGSSADDRTWTGSEFWNDYHSENSKPKLWRDRISHKGNMRSLLNPFTRGKSVDDEEDVPSSYGVTSHIPWKEYFVAEEDEEADVLQKVSFYLPTDKEGQGIDLDGSSTNSPATNSSGPAFEQVSTDIVDSYSLPRATFRERRRSHSLVLPGELATRSDRAKVERSFRSPAQSSVWSIAS